MIVHDVQQTSFDFFSLPVVVEAAPIDLTSDAGLLLFRQLDEELGFTAQFVQALEDPRCQSGVVHSYQVMARMRIYGILADYADQNDHDFLRHDPAFKLVAGRSPEDDPLASQPTLSRFENGVDVASLFRLQDVLIDQFIASFKEPPRSLTFDVDAFDDPTHGQQQLTFFHGYYEQYQYLPRIITCAENDLVVMAALLFGSASAGLGIEDDLQYLVARLREVWPDVDIYLRADSGFATPSLYQFCEEASVFYSIGLKMNARLKRQTDELLQQAERKFEATSNPQRLFTNFAYRADSWDRDRQVVVKCEAQSAGTNRRAVVTNRPGVLVLPDATYDSYADRGESENRNEELKNQLQADRLSDHRFLANYFRLYLHTASFNLLVLLRRRVVDPPSEEASAALPQEALADPARRAFFNARRRRDPLGEGQPCTWRTRVIKVAAEVIVRARRIIIRLPDSWPYIREYFQVAQQLLPDATVLPKPAD